MATSQEVLNLLIPDGGYVAYGNEYEGIQFVECKPITKAQYEAGFAQVNAYNEQKKAEAEAAKAAAQAKLAALGLTTDDLKALGL